MPGKGGADDFWSNHKTLPASRARKRLYEITQEIQETTTRRLLFEWRRLEQRQREAPVSNDLEKRGSRKCVVRKATETGDLESRQSPQFHPYRSHTDKEIAANTE